MIFFPEITCGTCHHRLAALTLHKGKARIADGVTLEKGDVEIWQYRTKKDIYNKYRAIKKGGWLGEYIGER